MGGELIDLKPGLHGTDTVIVACEHTAPHVGSGQIPVLATPVMVNLMEAAALAAVERFLPEGYQTVGTHLDVYHTKATPVGMRVTAEAELIEVNGRTLTFRLSAKDEIEPIGQGTHERIIVNLARFDQRVQAKAGQQPAQEAGKD